MVIAGQRRARLGAYLMVLEAAAQDGVDVVGSERLGEVTNVNATQVRRDLTEVLVTPGKRGVGYSASRVAPLLRSALGSGPMTGSCSVLVAARVRRLKAERAGAEGVGVEPLPWLALERAAVVIEEVERKAGQSRLLTIKGGA